MSKIILGIETSCDETAAAIIRFDAPGSGEILSNIVFSQIEEHAVFGGVVPEIASRLHLDIIEQTVQAAFSDADLSPKDIDAVAATTGPGLAGGLLVGAIFGRAFALSIKRPFHEVNHLEGHALTTRLTHGMIDPHLLLLVSGGHTQMLMVHDVGDYERLGTTIDDAAGEAFDKTAKLLGLGYPGGPKVEQYAQLGDREKIKLPRPMVGRQELHFSFSGLKTAVRQAAQKLQPINESHIQDICASFQSAMGDIFKDRLQRGIDQFTAHYPEHKPALVVSGGVAANQYLASIFKILCEENEADLVLPPINLCTDNAVMIAWAAAERDHLNLSHPPSQSAIRPRWPLDKEAEKARGAGVKA